MKLSSLQESIMDLQRVYGRTFSRNSADKDEGFWYVRYYPSEEDTRLEMFRKKIFKFQDVRRVMNNLGGDYEISMRSDAEDRAYRMRSQYDAIEVYGYNFKIATKNDMRDLPSWVVYTIMNRLKGRAYSRDRFSRTITSSFFDRDVLTKEDFNR